MRCFPRRQEAAVSKDITPIIEGWDYRPDRPAVRQILGEDGTPKIQLRLDLGLLQMEVTGRPDGKRPFGYETMLDYYAAMHRQKLEESGDANDFHLSEEDCMRLQVESMQFYHRRISWLELGEYVAAEKDSDHNLRIVEFVVKHAQTEQLREMFTQWKPFILVHRTMARARRAWEQKRFDEALSRIEEGIEAIMANYREQGREDAADSSGEIAYLRKWAEEIDQTRPLSLEQRLERELRQAIASEMFERAAILRDRLQVLRQSQSSGRA